jgi:two-component system, NarL family, invasion response regulator UvrY
MVRVVVCDDHPIFREGLKNTFAASRDVVLAGEASTGAELLDALRARRFDVVIMDISLPGTDWLELLKEIRSSHPRLPVVVLSMHPEEQYAVRALRAGAAGYVSKATAPSELVPIVRKVAGGRRHVSEALAEKLASELSAPGGTPSYEQLSDREFQVLHMLAAGKGTKEIAGDLSLSPPTVATYRSRILAKLGLRNNADIVRYAIEHGLLE